MMPSHSSQDSSVSRALKAHTSDHHHRAERSPFQQDLVKGRISRDEYARWLGQLLALFRMLEATWVEAGLESRYPEIGLGAWGRSAALEADLQDLGRGADAVQRTEATEQFVALLRRLGAERPLGLIGVVYVLEGSTNGSVYIARAIRGALGLTGRTATAYLDPYGPQQRARWGAFKDALDRLDEGGLPVMIEAAQATFDAVARLGDDVRKAPSRAGA